MSKSWSKHPSIRHNGPIQQQPAPSPPTAQARRRRAVLLCGIVIVAACALAAHWPGLSARALSFDDNQYLLDNVLVKNPGWSSARRFLCEVLRPSTVHGYYQPLSMISLMLDYAMGGRADDPYVFHRTSLVLHVLNAVLLTVLVYLLLANPWAAVLVGMLFAAHPLTVEPIPWIGERKTLLAALFALGCLVLYVRYARGGNWWTYGGAVGLFVLALMSKPTSTPLPACLLLLDYWPLRRLGKKAIVEKIPFFLIAGISAFITFYSQKLTAHVRMPDETSPMRIPLTLCHNIVFYPLKMIWPANLSSHYPIPDPLDLSNGMVLAGVIGTFLLLVALGISWRRTRGLVVGWSFFFIAIFPTMGVIGFNNVIASDKFAYLPSVGLLVALGGLVSWLWARAETWGPERIFKGLMVSCAAGLVLLEALGTRRYLSKWRDTETFYKHMLAHAPQSPWVHMDLANALTRKGKLDEAVGHYLRAIELRPGYPKFHYNLGITLSRRGDLDEAILHCKRAVQLMPDYAKGHNGLGSLLSQKGRSDEAIAHYRRAIELAPEYDEPYYNLANAHLRAGRNDQAIANYRKAIELRPGYAYAHYGLAIALERIGDTRQAVRHYRQAVSLNPTDKQARRRLERLVGPSAAGQ